MGAKKLQKICKDCLHNKTCEDIPQDFEMIRCVDRETKEDRKAKEEREAEENNEQELVNA